MTRKKVKLRYIEDAKARKASYKKRVEGIMKKMIEMNVLCATDACTIIYGPNEEVPVVWPSTEPELIRIITEYKRMPEIDICQRRFNKLDFVKESLRKAEEKLRKIQSRNKEIEIENIISDILHGKPIDEFSHLDVDAMLYVVRDKMMAIRHRATVMIEETNNNNNYNCMPRAHNVVNAGSLGFMHDEPSNTHRDE